MAVDAVATVERWMPKLGRDANGCWLWTGSRNPGRYAYGRVGLGRKIVYAHRLFYEVFRGEIPAGKELDHLCRNTGCVNPRHLEPVTKSTNIRRGYEDLRPVFYIPQKRGRRPSHCPQGHVYDAQNSGVRRTGNRAGHIFCLACSRDRHAAKRELQRSRV